MNPVNIIQKDYELRAKLIGELSKDRQTVYFKIISFVYKITQTIAIIAGFGFTAIGKVYNLNIFLLGEAFLFVSIFYGIYRVSRLYDSEMLWRDRLITKFYNAGSHLDSKSDTEEKRHEDFKKAILDGEVKELVKPPMYSIIILAIIGGSCLILSFLPFCNNSFN